MFHRTTSIVASALMMSGAAVALSPAAQAAPQTYTGHVQVVVGDEIIGCVAPNNELFAGHRTNTDVAYRVSITDGSQQNMMIVEGAASGKALGTDTTTAAYPMRQTGTGYAFLNAVTPVPAGSPSVDLRQSAVWSIDSTTRRLSATYVWDDSTTQPVETWYGVGGHYLGISPDVAAVTQLFGDIQPSAFRIGEACSGEVGLDPQAIRFDSSVPDAAHPGQTHTVAATGGASGNPVTFASTTSEHCTIEGTTVTFGKPGTCTIEANQAGGTDHTAAPSVTQDITVTAIPSSVALSLDVDSVSEDQHATATADVSVSTGSLSAAGGAVQFAVDGTDVGSPVAIDTDGRAASPALSGTVGTHEVSAAYVPEDATNYASATASANLTVTVKAAQAITFTSAPPSPAHPTQTYTVAATGGASGKAVTLSSTTAEHCTIDGSTVTFGKPGTCTIEANQAGATGYSAAPSVSQDITVSAIPSTVSLALDVEGVVSGQRTTATADVTVTAGSLDAASGSVQFAVDGDPVGAPVSIDADGRAVSPELGGNVGPHQVTATYVPADDTNYLGSTGAASLTVSFANTTTKVSVTASALTATVTPVAPGAGTPTGEVTFHVDGKKVGTATLDRGTAKLAHSVPTDTTHAVSAEYAGDAHFNASSASTARANPSITTRVSSSLKSRNGWYRKPVTISFTCNAEGAALVTACPKPVTVRKQGASTVTRTIRTADGGIATATAAVKLDRSKPRIAIKGVKAGRSYFDARKPKCIAKDSISGVAKCKVTSKRRGSKVVVTAKATDVAGNVRTKRVAYRVADFTIRGARKVGGAYRVKHGETYTLVVRGAKARYVYATPAPGKPNRGSVPFKKAGKNTWALGVTMSMTTSGTRSWNLGYTQGGTLHVVKVKVVG